MWKFFGAEDPQTLGPGEGGCGGPVKCFVRGEVTAAQTVWGQFLGEKNLNACFSACGSRKKKRPQTLTDVMGNNSFESVICLAEKKKKEVR